MSSVGSGGEQQYLEAGFDPHGLKMSAIRNILNKHSVEFPSNAKKSELLGILQRGVLDQASKLRKEAKKQKRVKGDGRDIEVMAPSSSAIGERTRARTPKPAERTRPPMMAKSVERARPPAMMMTKPGEAAKVGEAAKATETKTTEAKVTAEAKPKPAAPRPRADDERKPRPADAKTKAPEERKPTADAKPKAPEVRTPKALDSRTRAPEMRTPKAATPKPMVFGSHRKADEKKADEKRPDEKKPKKMRPVPRAPGSPAKATMDKAAAARAGTKRKLSDAEADAQRQAAAAVDSGDEEFFTPAKPPASPSARPRKHVTAHATPNFSDENPFQSSPETARKRRRKAAPADDASHAAATAAPVTPMAALRKSHASDVSFRVALPRAAPAPVSAPAPAPAPAPALPEEAAHDLDEDLDEEPFQPQPPKRAAELPGGTVEPLRRVELPDTAAPLARAVPTGPPRFSLAPPLASAPSSRFTMTPDALRQLAAASAATSQAPSHPRPAPHRRATTNQIAATSLPPVAPRISVAAPRNPLAPRVAKPVAAADSDADSDADPDDSGDLQRRRVATLRQHVEDSRSRHSRRSSVASSISESRGATGIPSRAARVARDSAPQFKRRQRRRRGVLGAVTAWVGVAAVALAAWRTHEQWELGFGNARADLAFQAPPPPLSATPVVPDQISDLISAHLPDQIAQWARRARALVQPPPLSCPEHAECTAYAALHAWRAAEPGPRDQWVVDRAPVVQCDAGHVIEWPALAPRWVPRVPACVRDASTELRVRALADALVAECAAHRGRVQCEGSLLDHARARLPRWANQSADHHAQIADEADEIERLGVSVADLRRQFVDRGSSDYMFRLAVDELAAQRGADVAHYVVEYEEEEGEGDSSAAPVERAFFVARRADLPLMCRVRRVALDALLGNLPALLGAVGAAVVALVVSRRVAARRAERRAAEALVGSALRRLKRQARRHYLDPALSPSPAIPSLQLRDLLLLSGGGAGPASLPDTPESEAAIMGGGAGGAAAVYYDPRARAGVWDRVRAVVERSANVRCRTTAVRGEPMRVWEWIGPLDDDSDEGMDAFSPFASPFGSPQRVLSPGPL